MKRKTKMISGTIIWDFHSLILLSFMSISTSTSEFHFPEVTNQVNNELMPDMRMTSNLSCYVCTTIEDINCKYLNETIHRHRLEMGHDGNSGMLNSLENDPYSPHHYTIDGGQSTDGLYGSSSEIGGNGDQQSSSNKMLVDNNLLNEFRADCMPNEQYCAVIRLGVSQPDNVQEFNFFALKRSCADQCNEGCFIIGNEYSGEKTKLSICSTCCTTNYCNVGNKARSIQPLLSSSSLLFCFMTIVILHYTLSIFLGSYEKR